MKKYKHFIILILVFAVTIISCVYALKWHTVYKENKLNTTIITDYIHELKIEEYTNYVSDNPYAIIYFGVTSDENCRRFENELKDYVISRNLREAVVYVNVNKITGDNFSAKFDSLFNTKKMRDKNKYLREVPAIAIYDHATLVDFISSSNLKVSDVKKLLGKYNFNGE